MLEVPILRRHAVIDQPICSLRRQLIIVELDTLVLLTVIVGSLNIAGRAFLSVPVVEVVTARTLDTFLAVEERLVLVAVDALGGVGQGSTGSEEGAVVGRWVGAVGRELVAGMGGLVESVVLGA